ncbi:unnamed protein product, partial [Trichogramma brassicae]
RTPEYLLRIVSSYLSARVLDYDADDGPGSYRVTAGVPQGSIIWSPHMELRNGDTGLFPPSRVSTSASMLARDQWPPTCLLRGNVHPGRYTTSVPPRRRALADPPTPPRGRQRRRTPRDIEKMAGVMGPVDKRPLDVQAHPEHQRAEVRPTSTNRQRKGSKSGWSPREDHAQPRRAQKLRELYAHVVDSILLYGAPVWSCATETQAYIRQAESVHQRACLRVISGRPHVSYDATYVIAGVPPMALLADERACIYQRHPEDVKEEERRETLNRWQDRWDRASKGRWTHRLIPNITEWVERGHGEVNYHLTQLLTGHGYFKSHSQRYDNTLSALCPACPITVEDAEHVFFRCPAISRREGETPTSHPRRNQA